MLRLVDVVEKDIDHIVFKSVELTTADLVAYVIYDTSTGITTLDDYCSWRATTVTTSTGVSTYVFIRIDNTNLYPSSTTSLIDYTELSNGLFKIMTFNEYQILNDTLLRIDLVRRRMPNPGFVLNAQNGIGQNGTVAMSGGFYKKMSVDEVMRMIEGTVVEINMTPPQTHFWPQFQDIITDQQNNPYIQSFGWPYSMRDITALGATIRCLMAVGILEVDISFSTSDSGLQLTFDRATSVKGWHDSLLQGYRDDKKLFKWNFANHKGVGVGTVPYSAVGIWGTLLNNVQYGGQLAMNSILGFNASGNVPM